jgi:hypothetical protein
MRFCNTAFRAEREATGDAPACLLPEWLLPFDLLPLALRFVVGDVVFAAMAFPWRWRVRPLRDPTLTLSLSDFFPIWRYNRMRGAQNS